MKTNRLITMFAVLTCAALALSSCKKEEDGPKKYDITLTSGTGGSATVTVKGKAVTSAAAGATVTLTAAPDDDYEFVGWTVTTDGDVSLEPGASASTATFTMPASEVSIKASFAPDDILTVITDPVFRAYADSNMTADKWDTDDNGKLSVKEAAAVTSIDVSGALVGPKIASMAGLEYFTGLTSLICYNNSFEDLDVSGLTALTVLDCSGNQLTTLDVSANTALTRLDCGSNLLTTLDVSGLTALTRLDCHRNSLTGLDVSQNAALTRLDCYHNTFPMLDVSANAALTNLDCGYSVDNPLKVIVATGTDLATDIDIRAWAKAGGNVPRVTDFGPSNSVNGVTVVTADWEYYAVEINGVTWAKCNVDAPGTFAAAPEDTGMYYQWNRRAGWSSSDPLVSTDGATTWNISNDSGTAWAAANDPCPDGWRVPTYDDINALINFNVTTKLVDTPARGYTFTDKNSGNSIFLPFAGVRSRYSDGAIAAVGECGRYWSSAEASGNSSYGVYLLLDEDTFQRTGIDKSMGLSVRCVTAE